MNELAHVGLRYIERASLSECIRLDSVCDRYIREGKHKVAARLIQPLVRRRMARLHRYTRRPH